METELLQEMDQTLLNSVKNTVDKERLEELVTGEKIVKITSCDVVNGHAVIQKLAPPSSSTTNVTFQEMVARFIAHVLKPLEGMPATGKTDICVTFDRYVQNSKPEENEGRWVSCIISSWRFPFPELEPVPFLKTSQNREHLAEYYTVYMAVHAAASFKEQQTLYIIVVDKVRWL